MTERFVKSKGTSVSVGNSRAELERVLRRYGASDFGSSTSYEKGEVRVFFRVPATLDKGAESIPIRLEVNIGLVAAALYGPLQKGQKWTEPTLLQAERVAWRHLVLWVDAACAAASAGMQSMAQAFFAHTLIQTEDGARPLFDHLQQPSTQKLLMPAAGVS